MSDEPKYIKLEVRIAEHVFRKYKEKLEAAHAHMADPEEWDDNDVVAQALSDALNYRTSISSKPIHMHHAP